MPSPPPLPDELLEEVFFRLPPDEPENLVRASLVSKVWLALLSAPRFRARYRDFHGAPPMLGFLYSSHWNSRPETEDNIPHFVPTTKFRACIPDDDPSSGSALDCRHGRVLIGDMGFQPITLVVWDPMTGCRRKLDAPNLAGNSNGAAVLCAVTGCDHRACHAGPIQVAFVGLKSRQDDCLVQACVSFPVTGDHSMLCFRSHFRKWSEPCSAPHLGSSVYIYETPPVLLQGALHFKLANYADACILMTVEDDSLGFAHVDGLILNLWSRHMGSDGVGSWIQCTVIDIKDILPIRNPSKRLRLIGSVEGTDVIFVTTDLGIYKINLNSLQWNKVWERKKFRALIPYMSFYNPQGVLSVSRL